VVILIHLCKLDPFVFLPLTAFSKEEILFFWFILSSDFKPVAPGLGSELKLSADDSLSLISISLEINSTS